MDGEGLGERVGHFVHEVAGDVEVDVGGDVCGEAEVGGDGGDGCRGLCGGIRRGSGFILRLFAFVAGEGEGGDEREGKQGFGRGHDEKLDGLVWRAQFHNWGVCGTERLFDRRGTEGHVGP